MTLRLNSAYMNVSKSSSAVSETLAMLCVSLVVVVLLYE